MLHTDAHNARIEKSKKMSKENFIQNNSRICKVSKEFLGDIYDRITKKKFEIDTDSKKKH